MVGQKRINPEDYASSFVVVQKQLQCSNLHLNGWWERDNILNLQLVINLSQCSILALKYLPLRQTVATHSTALALVHSLAIPYSGWNDCKPLC